MKVFLRKSAVYPDMQLDQSSHVVRQFMQTFNMPDTIRALQVIMNVLRLERKPFGSLMTNGHLPHLGDRFAAIPQELLHDNEQLRLCITNFKQQLQQGIGQQQHIRSKIALYEDYLNLKLEKDQTPIIPKNLFDNPELIKKAVVDLESQIKQVNNKHVRQQIRATIDAYQQHYLTHFSKNSIRHNVCMMESNYGQTTNFFPVPQASAFPREQFQPQFGYNQSLNRYTPQARLGEGEYGIVYRAWDHVKKKFVAMKKIRIEGEEEGMPATLLREISILQELRHKNIVELCDVVQDVNRIYLIFEFLDTDLKVYMERTRNKMDPMLMKSYLQQMLKGVVCCHSHRILHRDLKPQNILIDRLGNLKIADFGLARAFSIPIKPYTHEVVTMWYRAPEILLGGPKYCTAIDMWSVGCIFAEMSLQRPIFPGDSEIGQLYKIFQKLGTPNESTWPQITAYPCFKTSFPKWEPGRLSQTMTNLGPLGFELLGKMLIYPPNKRISARAALKHAYFNDFNH